MFFCKITTPFQKFSLPLVVLTTPQHCLIFNKQFITDFILALADLNFKYIYDFFLFVIFIAPYNFGISQFLRNIRRVRGGQRAVGPRRAVRGARRAAGRRSCLTCLRAHLPSRRRSHFAARRKDFSHLSQYLHRIGRGNHREGMTHYGLS